MKILVVRLDGFTEVLLTTPLIRCLRRQVSEAEIHVLTSHQQSHLLCHNPYFSKLHIWEEGKVIEQLQGENFDYLFDWQNSRQSRRLAKQIKAKTIIVAPLAKEVFFTSAPNGIG